MGALPDDSQLAARRLAIFTTGLYAAPSLLRAHGEPLAPEALHTMPALMLLSRSGEAIPWQLSPREAAPAGGAEAQAARPRRGATAPTHEIVPAQHMRANSPEALIRLARRGAGVVAVADFFAEPYIVSGELQRILPAWCLPDVECWAVFPGRRLMPAKTRVFIDMLARTMSTCSEAVDASAAKVNAAPGRFRVD
jgi:DNA-binding transcriptional LysR family regulator